MLSKGEQAGIMNTTAAPENEPNKAM